MNTGGCKLPILSMLMKWVKLRPVRTWEAGYEPMEFAAPGFMSGKNKKISVVMALWQWTTQEGKNWPAHRQKQKGTECPDIWELRFRKDSELQMLRYKTEKDFKQERCMEIQPWSRGKSHVWPSQPNLRISIQQLIMVGVGKNTPKHK